MTQVGAKVGIMSGGLIKPGVRLDDLFTLHHPLMLLNFINITHFINSVYIMEMNLTDEQRAMVPGGGICLKGKEE